MADSLIAEFPSQFAASAAVDRLLSRGIVRERLALRFDESVGRSAASASAPTTVISDLAHQGKREDDRTAPLASRVTRQLFRQRTPLDPPSPQTLGHASVVIRLDDAEVSALTELLRQLGASSVQHIDHAPRAENPAMWPAPAEGASADVQHARDAIPAAPDNSPPRKRPGP